MMSLALLLALMLSAEPSYPVGIEVHESECASGGYDYFFFEGGIVIAKCWGCEQREKVQAGTWRRDGTDVVAIMNREWFGQGKGRIVEVASVNVYESYVAVTWEVSGATGIGWRQSGRFAAKDFDLAAPRECVYPRRHQRRPDPLSFVRLFDGRFPATYQRVLDPKELEKLSPNELRLMRNEIVARYGFRFRDPELIKHFKTVKGYWPTLDNVDAFLSPVELANVVLLAKVEADARVTAPGTGTSPKAP
jgi:hypothetical protein